MDRAVNKIETVEEMFYGPVDADHFDEELNVNSK